MSEAVTTRQQELAGKYRPYPDYKDSGVVWLGDMPSYWLTSKLRYMFTFGKGLTITKENLRDEGIPCVNYGEVHSKYGFEVDPTKHPLRCVEEDYLKTSSSSVLNIGDFVFADTSEDIDGSGNFTQLTSDVVTFAGYHTIIVRPIDKSSHRFFAYLFDSKEFRTAIRHAVKGVKVFSITQAILRGADIWLPSQDERQRIAAFLDYETARIDRLIAQQQRLIELLKEKRQAVISHAVTKGLNPYAPMKDSGVEWLGHVPEHWVVCKIKNLAAVISKGTTPSTIGAEFIDEGVRFLKAENIGKSNIVSIDPEFFISEDVDRQISRSQLKENDVLVIIAGATTGFASVLQKELLPANTNQAVSFIRLLEPLHSKWVLYWLSTTPVQKTIWMGAVQAAQPNLSMENLGNIPIVIPPINEIAAHLKYIENKIVNFDNLAEKAGMAIQLMQERRTALISAAVTGKIDLRGWTQPAEEVAA
ncbi:restriction endonuclease subunit S [Aeromonas veronii]|uniref:restriction endonuclease subunit S n=1 Tax=Aeromonas veronii TaxID=654 RepID=UPI003B9E42F8